MYIICVLKIFELYNNATFMVRRFGWCTLSFVYFYRLCYYLSIFLHRVCTCVGIKRTCNTSLLNFIDLFSREYGLSEKSFSCFCIMAHSFLFVFKVKTIVMFLPGTILNLWNSPLNSIQEVSKRFTVNHLKTEHKAGKSWVALENWFEIFTAGR